MTNEELLQAFSDGTERFLGDAVKMAVDYGRFEGKYGDQITKILNMLGVSGEFSFSFVTLEYALDMLIKAIDEGRLEVRNGTQS